MALSQFNVGVIRKSTIADLRQQFFDELAKLAEEDEAVILLVGDLGYSFMENYAERFPSQFVNCGIAEQNMVGIAAGLALAGKKPYVYTGAVFYYRCLEQVRDDVAYNNLDVKLIGTGASGFLGFTHNFSGWEDMVEIMRTFPSIEAWRIDENQGVSLNGLLKEKGPMYLQL